ncbi:MAG: response regulator transcription factor [Bacteroidetes bacterium]|nr:response regulator transcription factor [Bacteroidota bacterium]MCB0842841.1 response regulator transcription factor [Bacteroidota bacterium]
MSQPKILIVDDEVDILDLLEYNLEKEGYEVIKAMDGEEAIRKSREHKPDMILLDIMMPNLDGIETCRRIRAIKGLEKVFIVFLTARSEEYSELAGFEAGADDYIPKPIKPRVLMSRLRAIFRREQSNDTKEDTLKVHDLEVIRDEYIVRRGEEKISLPRKEFELLYFLASYPGKVFRRAKLLEQVWGDVFVVDRTIDVHIRKLREKIGDDYIQTVKGVGYKLKKEE